MLKLAGGFTIAIALVVLFAAGLIVSSGDAARPAAVSASWAVVGLDTSTNTASLVRGRDAVGATATGTDGSFVVTFGKDVSKCAYTATGGNDTSPDDALTFGVSPRNGDPNSVFVLEYDTILARDSYSDGFHLVVNC